MNIPTNSGSTFVHLAITVKALTNLGRSCLARFSRAANFDQDESYLIYVTLAKRHLSRAVVYF
jgi:hypothetical protein